MIARIAVDRLRRVVKNGNDFIAFHFNHFHVEKWGKGIGVEVIRIDRSWWVCWR